MARFTVLLHPAEDGGYAVMIPSLHLATQGDTVEHALAMAREVAALEIAGRVEDHDVVVPELVPPIVASIEIDVPDAINAYADTEVGVQAEPPTR